MLFDAIHFYFSVSRTSSIADISVKGFLKHGSTPSELNKLATSRIQKSSNPLCHFFFFPFEYRKTTDNGSRLYTTLMISSLLTLPVPQEEEKGGKAIQESTSHSLFSPNFGRRRLPLLDHANANDFRSKDEEHPPGRDSESRLNPNANTEPRGLGRVFPTNAESMSKAGQSGSGVGM